MSLRTEANPVKEQLLRASSDQGKNPLVNEYDAPGEHLTRPPNRRRFWARTLVLILVPSIITAWYAIIWLWLVLGIENDSVVKYRTFSGSQIFYSWFMIGIFALSWATYGLAGVEVAMLESRMWRAPDLVAYLMHTNSTWSSPSGWLKAIWHRKFYRLWCLLTLVSLLPFIALPLSGLVFEIGDGYVAIPDRALVMGLNQSTFSTRTASYGSARNAWLAGVDPFVPGFGVLYTTPGYDRESHPSFSRVPNMLPVAETVPVGMFLTSQAKVPVSGQSWGMQINYTCANVRDASEFTILSEKYKSVRAQAQGGGGYRKASANLETPSGATIQIFTDTDPTHVIGNTWSYSEIGINHPRLIYNQSEDTSQEIIFEYALWQIQWLGFYQEESSVSWFNTTLDPVIEGLGGPYFFSENKTMSVNNTFFEIAESKKSATNSTGTSKTGLADDLKPEKLVARSKPALNIAPPIGVRCTLSSVAGLATVDGTTSTFSDFERVDPEVLNGPFGAAFGYDAAFILQSVAIEDFYQTTRSSPQVQEGNSNLRDSYLHPQALLQGVILASSLDALEGMFGVAASFDRPWEHPSMTSSREGRVLTIASLIPGVVTGHLVLVLLCLWAGLSILIGVLYGFRKRPSDKLDGYSVLKRGAAISEEIHQNKEFHGDGSFYDNKTFQKLPGS